MKNDADDCVIFINGHELGGNTMRDYVILADTSSDLSKEVRERFGIEYIRSHVVMPDVSEAVGDLSWNVMPKEEFYASLRKKGTVYATSPANVEEYAARFREIIASGKDVLSISLSSALSGTYEFANEAARMVSEEHPDAKIIAIDSLRYSGLLGLLIIHAAQLRAEGKTIDETAAWIEQNKNRFHQMGWMDDLKFLAAKGRLTNSKAFFGQLIGVKPVGENDATGLTTVLGKAKGEKNAYEAILGYIAETSEKPEEQIIFICNSCREKQAEAFRAMVEERFHPKEIIMQELFLPNGINMGPGLMTAYYVGKPISEGLKEETALMTRLLG